MGSTNLTRAPTTSSWACCLDGGNASVAEAWRTSVDPLPLYNRTLTELQFTIITSVYYSIRGIQSILALVGNSITIMAVHKFRYLRTTTNIFIVNLAIADMLVGLVGFPLSVSVGPLFYQDYMTERSDMWYAWCKVKEYVNFVSSLGNIYTIGLIGIERYLNIHYPLRYPSLLTKKRAYVMISVEWVVIILTSACLPVFFSNEVPPVWCDLRSMYPPLARDLGTAVLFGPVSLFIVLVYAKIAYHVIRTSSKTIGETATVTNTPKKQSVTQRKVTKMLLLVLGVYFVLYLPNLILMPFIPDGAPTLVWAILRQLVSCLWFTNIWINPVIYVLNSDHFKKGFLHILCYHGRGRTSSEASLSISLSLQRMDTYDNEVFTVSPISRKDTPSSDKSTST